MKKIISLLIATACVGHLHAGTVSGTRLSLKVMPKLERFQAGEHIHLEYTFKNMGDDAICILSTKSCYGFDIRDYKSGKQIGPYICLNYAPNVPTRESFVVLGPNECFTYKHSESFVINQDTNGVLWLEYETRKRPISESGFILKGHFHGSDYPMDEVYSLFKDLDPSIPLFRHGDIYSFVEFVYDGKYFQKKEVRPEKVNVDGFIEVYISRRKVKCARFEEHKNLITYTTDTARIEFKQMDLMNSLSERIRLHDIDADRLLLDHLKEVKGPIKLDSLNDRMLDRAEYCISDLLEKKKCQVYDLANQTYPESIIVAKWDDLTGGTAFMFDDDNTAFLSVLEWIP